MLEVLVLLAATIVGSGGAGEPVTVGGHGNPSLDACLSIGKILASPEITVELRNSPSLSGEVVGFLKGGELVHLCSVSEDGNWQGVVYGSNLNIDCEVGSPVDEETAYTGECKSGWIEFKFVELVAG